MNQIEVNPNREYYFGLDISGSMAQNDPKCDGLERYNYVLDKFKKFAKIAEDYDQHEGITIFLFGENVQVFPETKLENVEANLTNPNLEGATMLDKLLAAAFARHREEKGELASQGKVCPGTQLFVFTDGEPTNRAAVIREIVNIANAIDREDEFNIVFLTVGTIDPVVKTYLDNLHNSVKSQLKNNFNIIKVMEADKTDFIKAVGASLTQGK